MGRAAAVSLSAVAVLALLSAGCSSTEKEVEPEVSVDIVKAAPHALAEHVVTDAVLFPRNQAAITPKVAAPVARFLVQRGDRVQKGQLLAELENRDLAAAVKESQGAFEQAEAGYVTATRAGIPEEVKKAELDMRQAQQGLEAQTKLLESRKALFEQGALPRKDFDQAQVAYVQAKAQFDIAQQHYNSVVSVSREQDLKSAQGQLSAAQGKYEGSKAQFSYTEVRSPIDGVVTDRPAYAGETAAAGVPLLTVMDTTAAIAKTHLPQMAAQALKIGDAAEISVEGVSDPFPAKVTLISPALDANSTTVEVWVTADNRAQRLRPGASAKVDIVGRKANDAIAVPDQALVKTDAGPAVMIAGSDHKAHVRQVEVGIADGRQKLTQISSGLKAGEDVIVNGFGIPDGATVKANEAQPADKAAADEEKGQKKTDNKGQTKGAK